MLFQAGTRDDQLRATVASIEELKRQELEARSHTRTFTMDFSPLAPLLDSVSNPLLAGEIIFPKQYSRVEIPAVPTLAPFSSPFLFKGVVHENSCPSVS